jgi:hypothetical protein
LELLRTVPLSIDDPTETLRRGIRACRAGNWRDGLTLLTLLAQREEGHGGLPAFFYGYLGQAIARCEGRRHVGLELCRHAVAEEPFRPENHANLAAVYLIVGNRWAAMKALRTGLALDADHPDLLDVREKLGVRRSPILAGLARSNPLNVWLGWLSWWARSRREELRQRRLEEEELDLIG